MSNTIYVNAYNRAMVLYQRCTALGNSGYYDAAGFYIRKIIEVIADSFIADYRAKGMTHFEVFCQNKAVNPKFASLNDKVDFLLTMRNLPKESQYAYDELRKYGNRAVHKIDFIEKPSDHTRMIQLLNTELNHFYNLAMQ